MAHVVIIGASTGGLPAAYEMREALGKEHKVTVISNTDTFHFVPSNPWVAVGWRTAKDTSFKLEPRLKAKNIDFIPVAAKEALLERSIDVVLILAWRYVEPIAANNREFLRKGGSFLVPLPACHLYGAQE